MFSRMKRVIKRMLFGNKQSSTPIDQNPEVISDVYLEEDPLVINDNEVIVKRDMLEESLPIIERLANLEEKLIPRRKVTSLEWNGPIMEVGGYFYLEGIPMLDEDLVKKRLLLVNTKANSSIIIPLTDVAITEVITDQDIIDEQYYWAGFKGKVNFATISDKNMPLYQGEYRVYLEVEVHILGDRKYSKSFTLGNVNEFLANGFHSTKMEYFTAKREMAFNLLVTYDLPKKTLKITSTKLKDMDPAEMALDAEEKERGFVYKALSKALFNTAYRFYSLYPLKENKIVFASDSRDDLSGNFQFVYDELLRRNEDFEFKFMLKRAVDEKKTYRELIDLAKQLATSKYILLDDFYPLIYPLKIREGAELIQLWHAVGAFKTFGFSRLGRPGGPSPKSINHRNYTKAIVSSEKVAKHYAEGFGIDQENVIPTGIPRTDVFFDTEYQQEVRERLYEEYPFLKNKKVIMFAPTFRGNGQQSAHYPMEVLDLKRLYENLSDEYVFLFKIHPFVKNDISIPYQYSDFYYDFSSYREINDLLFITDILITDYSSVCFEFALLNKPMLFFAYDVEEYVRTRDFYYEFHSFIPGPLVRTADEIVATIAKGDYKMEKIPPFVNYFFGELDGKSSARVVDQLILNKNPEEDAE
ncbi:CDP-glycerol glycerophosphotransferase family protein [Bacillus sp. D386]|uniref:CDP-glycerol glycerophosphotransferase family protein n=1 Tax=Bacillus sp. D386 TaxID=2587155 RepID=UPI00214C6F55|nr:CDP-glycerol glycerophosphotransferase family protein [Bacillus sp. D386]